MFSRPAATYPLPASQLPPRRYFRHQNRAGARYNTHRLSIAACDQCVENICVENICVEKQSALPQTRWKDGFSIGRALEGNGNGIGKQFIGNDDVGGPGKFTISNSAVYSGAIFGTKTLPTFAIINTDCLLF
ncbi:hypothetical protein Ddc_18388 [Ditylenchus destructor]|nr:hypothetical protein Ddc_18388 [Ditylenchus destructor]